MFQSIDDVAADLRRYCESDWQPTFGLQSLKTEAGRVILQIASGKSTSAQVADIDSDALTAAARRVVSEIMLAPTANHFTVLGLDSAATPADVRDHFRRLMALVHPDANPVGFPADAAARVNRAYAVLSNEKERDEYRAALWAGADVGTDRTQYVRSGPYAPDTTGDATARTGVLRGLFGRLRSRHVLPALAVLLALPAIFVVWSMLGQSEPTRLVDASHGAPASRPATAVQSPSEVKPVGDVAIAAASAPAATVPAALATSAPSADTPAGPAPPLQLSLVDALSERSMELAAARRQKARGTSGGSVAPSTSTAPKATNALPAPAASSTSMPVPPSEPTPVTLTAPPAKAVADVPAAATAATMTSATLPSVPVPAKPVPGAAGPEPLRPRDVEDVLLRFVNAYESGSLAGFAQLLSSRMTGRRQMLSDYERVFAATRLRSIKLNQMKHSTQGDRVSSAGYAIVTTTDQDNRTAVQRVFLEIEIARDGGQARIERLANYSVN